MNYKKYEKTLKKIKMKAPIESGVQTLAYMLIDELLENFDYDVVLINTIHNQVEKRYTTPKGMPDLAIVTNDFEFKSNVGSVKLFVEVKEISENLDNHKEQLKGQLKSCDKAIITNGIEWRYYEKPCEMVWDVKLGTKKEKTFVSFEVANKKYVELVQRLYQLFESL